MIYQILLLLQWLQRSYSYSYQVSTIVGQSNYGFQDEFGSNSKFYFPTGVAISFDSSYALISDYYKIRKIDLSTHQVVTIAGSTFLDMLMV